MFKGFQKPKRLVANTETLTERFGQFTAQPFQRGFGIRSPPSERYTSTGFALPSQHRCAGMPTLL